MAYAGGTSPVTVWVDTEPTLLASAIAAGPLRILLLNRGAVTVYVGDAYASAGQGVPLPPLASLAVDSDQAWYAVADPAAADPQPVHVVPSGISYTAGAAEIAAQIALQGIPNTDRLTDLGTVTDTTANSTTVAAADTSQYGSLIVASDWGAFSPAPTLAAANVLDFQVDWFADENLSIYLATDRWNIGEPETNLSHVIDAARVPARGPWATVKYRYLGGIGALPAALDVAVFGSYRFTTDLALGRHNSEGSSTRTNVADGADKALFWHNAAFTAGQARSAFSHPATGPAVLTLRASAGAATVQAFGVRNTVPGTAIEVLNQQAGAAETDTLIEIPNGALYWMITKDGTPGDVLCALVSAA